MEMDVRFLNRKIELQNKILTILESLVDNAKTSLTYAKSQMKIEDTVPINFSLDLIENNKKRIEELINEFTESENIMGVTNE